MDEPMSWLELNKALRKVKTEAEAMALYKREANGQRRPRWLVRIFGRYKRLRNKREVGELRRAGKSARPRITELETE